MSRWPQVSFPCGAILSQYVVESEHRAGVNLTALSVLNAANNAASVGRLGVSDKHKTSDDYLNQFCNAKLIWKLNKRAAFPTASLHGSYWLLFVLREHL